MRNNIVYVVVAAALLILFFNLRVPRPVPAQAPPFDAHHALTHADMPGYVDEHRKVEYPDRPLYDEPSYSSEPASTFTPSSGPASQAWRKPGNPELWRLASQAFKVKSAA